MLSVQTGLYRYNDERINDLRTCAHLWAYQYGTVGLCLGGTRT